MECEPAYRLKRLTEGLLGDRQAGGKSGGINGSAGFAFELELEFVFKFVDLGNFLNSKKIVINEREVHS